MHRIAIIVTCLGLMLAPAPHAQLAPEPEADQGVHVAAVPGGDPDDETAMRVTMALKDDPAWGTIRVDRVDQGIVWLRGTITNEGRLADALHAIEDVEGVREIRNEVRVDSAVGASAPDDLDRAF